MVKVSIFFLVNEMPSSARVSSCYRTDLILSFNTNPDLVQSLGTKNF